MKPPVKVRLTTKKRFADDLDEGKEGTADDEESLPCKVDVRHKECKTGGCPTKRGGADRHRDCSASKTARAARDFGTPQNRELQAMYAATYRTLVSMMFLSLGLSNQIVNAIVDEQCYNTPQALNCLDKKGVKQFVLVIGKPGGMKDGTCNLGINVPLQSQAIIMGMCFALKHQRQCGEKLHPSLINLKILEELWLQQEIKDAHNNKEAYNTQPVWDSKKHTASANLIEQHFQQIQGRDGAPCAYFMHKHVIPPVASCLFVNHVQSFDNLMIKFYPIIKPNKLLPNPIVPRVEPPLMLYTHEAAEDNACCFQELKCIVQGTKAEVYVDEYNIHSEFRAT